MARKPKSPRRKRKVHHRRRWASVDFRRHRRLLGSAAVVVAGLTFVIAGLITVARLEAHVESRLLDRFGPPAVIFVDRPDRLAELAGDDLDKSISELLASDWTDDRLCRDIATRLSAVGWVARVNFVRRTADARFEVGADYRLPVAMVQQADEFLLVDGEGVRLPGTYLYNPAWKLIQGVNRAAPQAGAHWEGDDLDAALAIVAAVANEPYSDQITAVLVDNLGGRRHRLRNHIELATDRAGGRIRWGTAPGFELEENTVEQKLAILRENYRKTGRLDAHHPVIDISTFPDRFTIPG